MKDAVDSRTVQEMARYMASSICRRHCVERLHAYYCWIQGFADTTRIAPEYGQELSNEYIMFEILRNVSNKRFDTKEIKSTVNKMSNEVMNVKKKLLEGLFHEWQVNYVITHPKDIAYMIAVIQQYATNKYFKGDCIDDTKENRPAGIVGDDQRA